MEAWKLYALVPWSAAVDRPSTGAAVMCEKDKAFGKNQEWDGDLYFHHSELS